MEHDQDLETYRERLLDNLRTGSRRSRCGASDAIQVFVNQQRVGFLDGSGGEANLQVRTEARIDDVHLRSEDGVLLGGLSAPEYGVRSVRVHVAGDTVELRVQNFARGGSVHALYLPAPSLWQRVCRTLSHVPGVPQAGASALSPAMRVALVAQGLLVVLLAGAALEHWTGRSNDRPVPVATLAPQVTQAQVPWAASLTDVTKLERQLGDVSRLQAQAIETIQAQQQGMAQLQRTIAKLSAGQETVAAGMLTVKQEIEQTRKGTGREVDRVTRMLMTKAQTEQEQLEAEVHSLSVANERLAKERMELEQRNQDLKKRLKSAGVEVSKATGASNDKSVAAVPPADPPHVADAKPDPGQLPFLFWVTFSDGTSQESIDQWVRDMRGRKGAVLDGWQSVEILSPIEPMERFLDQMKQTKIVKAVKVSR